uniref:G-protein coupled receptors family 2 profile 2 domain-containing protein n=1 Tax=Strigamia maritima TaxID=126957 RepID=T1J465_STRMM
MNETVYSEECIFYANGSTEFRNFITNIVEEVNDKKFCVPFTKSFLSCWRWKFSSKEFFYNATNGNLTYNLNGTVYELGNYNKSSADQTVVLCIPSSLYPEYFYFDYIFVIICVFSILCLIAAFHLHLKSSRNSKIRHYDVKPMLCHMVCVCINYITDIVYVTMFSINTTAEWEIFLFALGFGSIHATLTWLNVLTFDMWNQFRPKNEMIQIEHTTKGFLCRCLYAFSLPALLMIFMNVPKILMSSVNSVHVDPIGMENDWLTQVFGLGAGAVFNCINLLFSILTMINVRKARKSIGTINCSQSNKSLQFAIWNEYFDCIWICIYLWNGFTCFT